MNLTEEVLRLATEAGFTRAGISPPSLSSQYVKAFQKYTDAGRFGTMRWMRRYYNFAEYIQERFPWAESVLVVVDNYYQSGEWPEEFPKIARYAWGADYHKIVARKLKRVFLKIKALEPATIARAYVDAGPVMQKAFAVQAGLGWIGKNDLLIVPDVGSYCFIGTLFLNYKLQFNEPLPERCGNCRKCLEACPTGALIAEHSLDARRCTTYLTIEEEREFSASEAANLHGWLYGCDTCQMVCPHNQKWNQPGDPQYGAYFEEFGKSVDDWLKLTENEFKQVFRNSPIRRHGFAAWRRNLLALAK